MSIILKIKKKLKFAVNQCLACFKRSRLPTIYPRKVYEDEFLYALKNQPSIGEQYELNTGFAIESSYFNQLVLYTQVGIKDSDLNFQHGRILYSLLSKYLVENKITSINILETGTARGFSSIIMARALLDQGVAGRIHSIDIISHIEPRLWGYFLDNEGPVSRKQLLKNWSEEASMVSYLNFCSDQLEQKLDIDRFRFAFLDAVHSKKAVLSEYSYLKKRQHVGDIIFFDDATSGYFDGVIQALHFIKEEALYHIDYIYGTEQRSYAVATRIKN